MLSITIPIDILVIKAISPGFTQPTYDVFMKGAWI